MALRYLTQPLKVAANASAYSFLQFVGSGKLRWTLTCQAVVHNFGNLRHPMAYTIIKDRKQVEHNYATLIHACACCALPLPLEFHLIWWLHIPLNPETGALNDFPGWDVPVILRILTTTIPRLVGRVHGEAPSGLYYPYVCDISRMYCARTEPLG